MLGRKANFSAYIYICFKKDRVLEQCAKIIFDYLAALFALFWRICSYSHLSDIHLVHWMHQISVQSSNFCLLHSPCTVATHTISNNTDSVGATELVFLYSAIFIRLFLNIMILKIAIFIHVAPMMEVQWNHLFLVIKSLFSLV